MPTIPRHPLAEVFGFPANNHSREAVRHRQNRLCPEWHCFLQGKELCRGVIFVASAPQACA
jgi:hypothetical protein